MRARLAAVLFALCLLNASTSSGQDAASAPAGSRPDSLTRSSIGVAAFAAAREDLGPTTDPPWNPPHAIARRRGWEQAILLPQRIATYPLSALGYVADRSLLFAEQTAVVDKLIYVTHILPQRT